MPDELPSAISPLDKILPFGNIQLIVFDLDGTLLKTKDSIPGDRFRTLRASSLKFGVKTTIATGRTLFGAMAVVNALGGMSNVPVALYNGSVVIQLNGNKVIKCEKIPGAAINDIISAISDLDIRCFFYAFDADLYTRSGSHQSEQVSFVGGHPPSYEYNGMPITSTKFSDINPLANNAILLEVPDSNKYDLVVSRLTSIPGITVTRSGGRYIEVRPFGVTKASAIRDVAIGLGLESSEILAVGDNDNDIELLKWAGISVSVRGASAAASNSCTHFSNSGPESAAIEVLGIVRQAKRLQKGSKNKNDLSFRHP